jgi:hypothetical protein
MHLDVNFSALFLTVLTLFSGVSGRAETAANAYGGSEIAVFTPWSFFQKSLSTAVANNQNAQKDLGDLDVTLNGFNFHLGHVQWKLAADFAPGVLTPNSYELKSNHLAFTLSIDKISLNQTVEQVIGGVLVQVQVQADCGPLTMAQSSAQASARIGFQLGAGDVATHVDQFDLQWPTPSWQISALSCQGPAGIDLNIQTQLASALATSTAFKPMLQDELAKYLQDQVGGLLEKLKMPVTLPIDQSATPLALNFKNFQTVNGGVLTFGSLIWNDKANVRPFALKDAPTGLASDAPILLTTQEGWTDLLTAQIAARPEWTAIDLRAQDFFMRVLNSRLLQFFLWPDLWNFSKSSPFTLAVGKPANLKLSWNADGSAKIAMDSFAWVQSLRKNKSWNIIGLSASASGKISAAIHDGQLSLQAQIQSSGLKGKFADDYIKAFNPNTWLATSLLQDFFNKMGQNVGTTIPLPALDLGILGSAKANGWNALSGGLIAIPFQVSPAK